MTPHQPPQPKRVVPWSAIGAIYVRNLQTPRFVFYAVAISFVWMAYFAFVSCSSGPLQLHLGLSALHYGAVLGFAALGYVAGSQTARRLARGRRHRRHHWRGLAGWTGGGRAGRRWVMCGRT